MEDVDVLDETARLLKRSCEVRPFCKCPTGLFIAPLCPSFRSRAAMLLFYLRAFRSSGPVNH
jgi:hypothetical protein